MPNIAPAPVTVSTSPELELLSAALARLGRHVAAVHYGSIAAPTAALIDRAGRSGDWVITTVQHPAHCSQGTPVALCTRDQVPQQIGWVEAADPAAAGARLVRPKYSDVWLERGLVDATRLAKTLVVGEGSQALPYRFVSAPTAIPISLLLPAVQRPR